MATPKYFRLAVINKNDQKIEAIGSKVFENHHFAFHEGLSSNQMFINIIFCYLASLDLAKTEQELINRGFATVDTTNIPEELIARVPILLCDYNYSKSKDAFSKEEGLKFLNHHLPSTSDELSNYLKRKMTN